MVRTLRRSSLSNSSVHCMGFGTARSAPPTSASTAGADDSSATVDDSTRIGVGVAGHDLLERVLAATVGNVQVEGDDVGTQRSDQGNRFEGGRCLTDHLDVGVGFEDSDQLGALNE